MHSQIGGDSFRSHIKRENIQDIDFSFWIYAYNIRSYIPRKFLPYILILFSIGSLPKNDAQRPGLWEGWEIEFLLPGLGRIFFYYGQCTKAK